jgi:hypothetical protein
MTSVVTFLLKNIILIKNDGWETANCPLQIIFRIRDLMLLCKVLRVEMICLYLKTVLRSIVEL